MAQDALDYDVESRTARLGGRLPKRPGSIAVIAAGTSDVPVAREAVRTLEFSGVEFAEFFDVGVAGLWRIEACIDEIRTHDAVIVAAGMDAALVSVLGGLLAAPIIAVPTSVGYGVATGGHTALNASLASCAQGVTVVNIDNGFGAACAALDHPCPSPRALPIPMELLRPIWSVGKQLLDRPSNREWLEQYSAAKDVVDPWAHRRSSLIKNRDDLANVCATISEIVRRSSHSQQVFSLAQGPQVNLVTATGLWICGEPATSFSSCGSGEWINKCSSTGSRELAPK
ncbi:Pyridinium-3,5-biscarboxylic acid mononucleotide synthase [Nymphon striatum]|nr:Pyridinium-3,5-biscarboxylic acid mononucleotide synthase [Nymphon striatum]